MKKSLQVLTAFAGAATLFGAGIAKAQYLYVTDQTSDQLTIIAPGGGETTISNPITQSFLDSPTGIAADTVVGSEYYGDVFVANNADGTIVAYNPTLGDTVAAFTVFASGLTDPAGLAFDSNGDLFVASDTTSGSIAEYSGLNLTTVNSSYSTGINSPYGIAATGNGQLAITLGNGQNLIKQIATGGGNATMFTPTIAPNVPEGIVYGPNGDLYVVNAGSNDVDQVKVSGAASVAATDATQKLGGLIFDSNYDLYVTDLTNDTVAEYELTGVSTSGPTIGDTTFTYLGSYATGAGPTFLAFDPVGTQAVPEPTSYALLVGGLFALYAMQRRRAAALVKI